MPMDIYFMKKVPLTAVCTASSLIVSSAFAADLPSYKNPSLMAVASSWQGLYAGINAGYGLNNISTFYQYAGVQPINNYVQGGLGSAVVYVGGAVAGAQLGYNHVFANHWMGGAELDLDWADVYNNTNPNQQTNFTITQYGLNASNSTGQSSYSRLGLNWIGTARARIGYDLGRFLPYLTGGLAYGGLTETINTASVSNLIGASPNASFTNGSSSTVSFGWAAGAGAEFMVTDNWSIKGEYLFTSIGGISTPVQAIAAQNNVGGVYYAQSGTNNTGSFGVHQVRTGLNYHTNWFSASPTVAKY